MTWVKLDKSFRIEDFDGQVSYAGFDIRSQAELDALVDICETMAANGCSDRQIAEASYNFLLKRNLH